MTLPDTPSATSQEVDRDHIAASPIRCRKIAPPAREKFLRAVAANLNGQAEVGDGRLDKLIRKLLEEFYLERSVRLRAAMNSKNFRERGYDSDWTRLAREFKRA